MKPIYQPNKKDRETLDALNAEITVFVEQRNKTYPEFNDRTLQQFKDDNDKRLNAYTLDRESQDKEDWQANIAMPTIRNKMKKMIAGFSLVIPEMNIRAYGEENTISVDRAFVADKLIKGSYMSNENSILENFWENWEAASTGTVFKYEGYLKSEYKQKFIKSYNIVTGEVESEERTVNAKDKCVSILLPISEIFLRDFYINDIQDQPSIAWVKYMSKDAFTKEFGQYKKASYVNEGIPSGTESDTETFFYSLHGKEENGEKLIEVIRYYNQLKDQYIIAANGVLLLDAPLLWRVNGEKVYPFAKAIFEPFVGKHFAYGNSIPNILIGEYDIYNTLWNSVLDKEYRSLVRPMLVGRANQDQFDLEDEFLNTSTRIYVNDVQQVKPMMTNNVDNSDIMMLQMVARGIEETAPSLPDSLGKKESTAREVVIAEEKLRELKVINQELGADLWRQKYYLRLANIQLNYPQPRKIVDKDGKEKTIHRTFLIENIELEKGTGEIGVLAIQFRDVKKADRKKVEQEVAVEEEMMKKQGISYRKMILSTNFLDNHEYQIEIISDTLLNESIAKQRAVIQEKLSVTSQLFPEIFMANQERFFAEAMEAYKDTDIGIYLMNYRKLVQQQQEMMMREQGGGGEKPEGQKPEQKPKPKKEDA